MYNMQWSTNLKWSIRFSNCICIDHLTARLACTIKYKTSLVKWGSKIQKHLKSGLFDGQISIRPVFKWLGFNYSPNHSKTGSLKILTFLSGFQLEFDKMATICLYFKWLGFLTSDPIQNLDHLQPNLFSII